MKIYKGIEEFEKIQNAVVTSGTFDGVHIGHQSILNRLIHLAKKIKGESVLLTFFPHPRMVLQADSNLKLINTIEEKTKLLEQVGIDHLIIHPFTKAFSRTTSLEFVRDILVNKIGTKKLVIGYDHHFGRNREGTFEHLKEFGPLYGFEVEEISAQDIDDVKVSSTKIRKAISEGDITTANEYLGHPFKLTGKVVRGNQIGRQLGYPTANLEIDNPFKLIPANGIYAIEAKVQGKNYRGMLNIGTRPTIEDIERIRTIEAHFFDFDQDIYGLEVEIFLIQRIRDEMKFENRENLIKAMNKDRIETLKIFNT